jgi:predicted N-acetyltransferase YhbS
MIPVPSIRVTPVTRTGADYLRLATALLQQMRLDSPAGGIWEAADVQWWSRQERATDRDGQLFWLDEQGRPQAAVLMTDFRGTTQCDVLVRPQTDPDLARTIWQTAITRAAAQRGGQQGARPTEFPVRPDDAIGITELTKAGLRPQEGPGVIASWLDAKDRPEIPPLAGGYRLVSRAEAPDQPHPLIPRNGQDVERRLSQCSIYQPDLDLAVLAQDGTPAGYALFWPDPATGVGLVEPMRTEQQHQGQGIASHLLAAGLARLAGAGCHRLKVSNDLSIYLRAGFQPLRAATAAIYVNEG